MDLQVVLCNWSLSSSSSSSSSCRGVRPQKLLQQIPKRNWRIRATTKLDSNTAQIAPFPDPQIRTHKVTVHDRQRGLVHNFLVPEPLPPEEEKQLKETLQEIIGHGKTVKLEQKINQSILGGLVVEFGQKLFDMSIRTRARQMEKFLRDPVNFDNL